MIERLVDTLLRKEQEISYIWIKERTEDKWSGVYDTGDGLMRPVTYRVTGATEETRVLQRVSGVVVVSGKSEAAMNEVKKRWGENKKKKGSELDKLRERYKVDGEGKRRLVRILEVARRLQQEGKVANVSVVGDEVHVGVGKVRYVFGVNYGGAISTNKEIELFEFVPHKESMRIAKEKCNELGIGSWIQEIITSYDLRRKGGVRV